MDSIIFDVDGNLMGFHRNRSTGLDLVSADQGTYGYYADFPTVDVFVRSASS